MDKKSFTLFEVLISLIILAVALSIIVKIFTSNNHIETYNNLQNIENNYMESGVVGQSEEIQFQKN